MKKRHAKRKSNRISRDVHGDIVRKYSVDLVPMVEIALEYGVSRMSIWKVLRKSGVDTRKGVASVVETKCSYCRRVISKPRYYYRKMLHHFCCNAHYFKWLNREVSPFIRHRHSLKIARKKVAGIFLDLHDEHIVHHENRDQTDNRLENLRVFANQGDHVRYHRGFDVVPVWDGRTPYLKCIA